MPFKRLSGGTYRTTNYAQETLIEPDNLELLLKHNRKMIANACDMIFDGRIDLYPAKWSSSVTALQYSPFKSIMQFDAMLPENRYFVIPSVGATEILKSIKEGD